MMGVFKENMKSNNLVLINRETSDQKYSLVLQTQFLKGTGFVVYKYSSEKIFPIPRIRFGSRDFFNAAILRMLASPYIIKR